MSTCMSTSRSNYTDMSIWKKHADHSTNVHIWKVKILDKIELYKKKMLNVSFYDLQILWKVHVGLCSFPGNISILRFCELYYLQREWFVINIHSSFVWSLINAYKYDKLQQIFILSKLKLFPKKINK